MLVALTFGISVFLLFCILHTIQLRKKLVVVSRDKFFYQQALVKFPSFYTYNTEGKWTQFLLRIGDKFFENLDEFLLNFPNYPELTNRIATLKSESGSFTLLVQNTTHSFIFEGSSIDDKDKVIGMILFIYDISEYKSENLSLKQRCSELQAINNCYQNLLERSPYIIWKIDKEGKLIYANTLFNKIRNKYAFDWTLGGGNREEVLIIKNIPRLYSILEITTQNNVYGFGHEVTEVGELRQEVKQNRKLQDAFLEYSPNAIAIFNTDSSLHLYNRVFLELFKLSEKFLESKPKFREIINNLYNKQFLKMAQTEAVLQKEELIFSSLEKAYQFYFNLDKKERSMKIYTVSVPYFKGMTLIVFYKIP